jgi:transposase
MVAELKPRPVPAGGPDLLYEPEIQRNRRNRFGWRRLKRGGGVVRIHDDDAFGAKVQHAIVRYALTRYSRKDMARDLNIAPKTAQDYLSGLAMVEYTWPVIRALNLLGIPVTHGLWSASWGSKEPYRPEVIAAAQRGVLARALKAIDNPASLTREQVEELRSDIRLLLAPFRDSSQDPSRDGQSGV